MIDIIPIFYLIAGVVLAVVSTTKEKLFFALLTFCSIVASGLMVWGKYFFVDEFFVFCIVFGGVLAIRRVGRSNREEKEEGMALIHKWLFIIMAVYMMIQAVRGMIVLDSLRKVRWVVYYGMLGLLPLVVAKKRSSLPDSQKLCLMISLASLTYFTLYLSHGFWAETLRGLNRFDLQNVEWAGTAYAMFPVVLAIPAALFMVKDKNRVHNCIGWAALTVIILAGFYYNSRVSWLVILAFFPFSFLLIGPRKAVFLVLIFMCFVGLFVVFGNLGLQGVGSFFKKVFVATQAFWKPGKADLDRHAHIRSAFASVRQDPRTFLFGYGLRSHGSVIGPYILRFMESEKAKNEDDIAVGKDQPIVPEVPANGRANPADNDKSTIGFTALVVDTGLTGFLLLVVNFFMTGVIILRQGTWLKKAVILVSLCLAFLWIFVTNLFDITLFYLMIMPAGLLVNMSKNDAAISIR